MADQRDPRAVQLSNSLPARQRAALLQGASLNDATLGGKIPLYPENESLVDANPNLYRGTPNIGGLLKGIQMNPRQTLANDPVVKSGGHILTGLKGLLATPEQSTAANQEFEAINPPPFRNLLRSGAQAVQNTPLLGRMFGGDSPQMDPIGEEGVSPIDPRFGGLPEEEKNAQPPGDSKPVDPKDLRNIAEFQKAQAKKQGASDPMADLRQVLPKEDLGFLDQINEKFDLTTVGLALMASAGNGESFGSNLGRSLIAGKNQIAKEAAAKESAIDRNLARRKILSEVQKNLAAATKDVADARGVKAGSSKVTGEQIDQAVTTLGAAVPGLDGIGDSGNSTDKARVRQLGQALAKFYEFQGITDPVQQQQWAARLAGAEINGNPVIEEGWFSTGIAEGSGGQVPALLRYLNSQMAQQ